MYKHELENVKEFMGLTDFCKTFKLQRGKNESDDDDPAVVGEFKARFVLIWSKNEWIWYLKG